MTITELQRSGAGTLEDGQTVFRWTSAEHATPQGIIDLHLQVKTIRKEIPGGDEVVEQVMSATWQPFQLNGEWDDKWGNRRFPSGTLTRTGTFAFTTFNDLAAFVQRKPLVRIELDSLSFVGLITDLKVGIVRKTKINYSITISPHRNESVHVAPQKSLTTQSIPKWLVDAASHVGALSDSFDKIRVLPLKTPRVDTFTVTMLEINDALNRLQRIGSDGFGTDTEARLLLMATTFRRLRGSGVQAALALARLTSSVDVAFDDILLSIRHAEWISSSLVESWKMVATARLAELDIRGRARQKPKAIYYPKRGESLERISTRFYGTPDNWRAIYDKNNLSSLTLDGNEELIIPERSSR